MKHLLFSAVLMIAMVATAQAQSDDASSNKKIDEIVSQLDLSDDQTNELKEVLKESQAMMGAQKKIIEANKRSIKVAESVSKKLKAKMEADISEILDENQMAKFKELKQKNKLEE